MSEVYEDLVALAFEFVLGNRSGGSKLVEVVEPRHDLGFVGRPGGRLLPTLLASFAFGRFTVVALSGYPSFARAFSSAAHFELPVLPGAARVLTEDVGRCSAM